MISIFISYYIIVNVLGKFFFTPTWVFDKVFPHDYKGNNYMMKKYVCTVVDKIEHTIAIKPQQIKELLSRVLCSKLSVQEYVQ